MKRILICALCLTLLLCACGSPAAEEAVPVMTTETPAPEPTQAPVPEIDPAEPKAPDFAGAYAAYPPETPVFTAGGVTVDWELFYGAMRRYAEAVYYDAGLWDYDALIEEGLTAADWVLANTETDLRSMALVHGWAAELGLSLSEEDLAEIDGEIQTAADAYAGGDLAQLLEMLAYTEGYIRFYGEAAKLSDALTAHFFGTAGSELSEADAIAYVTDQGYLYAKHILFLTVDDSDQQLDEEAMAQKRAQAEEVSAQLSAAAPEELPELFDSLMHQYSQDPGLASYPDGYYFLPGEMVAPFEEAAAALAEGEVSGIVETPYGYHILYRPPMSADHPFQSNGAEILTMRAYVSAMLFNNMAEERFETVTAEYFPEFEALDLNRLFGVF